MKFQIIYLLSEDALSSTYKLVSFVAEIQQVPKLYPLNMLCISCLNNLQSLPAGYGVTAPHNNLSKALSVIYALLGIPVYAVYLSYAYLAISTALNALSQLLFTCIRYGFCCILGSDSSCRIPRNYTILEF